MSLLTNFLNKIYAQKRQNIYEVAKKSKKNVVCSFCSVNRLAFPRDVAVAFVRALAGPDDAYARLAQHLDGTDGGGGQRSDFLYFRRFSVKNASFMFSDRQKNEKIVEKREKRYLNFLINYFNKLLK